MLPLRVCCTAVYAFVYLFRQRRGGGEARGLDDFALAVDIAVAGVFIVLPVGAVGQYRQAVPEIGNMAERGRQDLAAFAVGQSPFAVLFERQAVFGKRADILITRGNQDAPFQIGNAPFAVLPYLEVGGNVRNRGGFAATRMGRIRRVCRSV